jgi:hypothetical protein
MYEKIGNLVDRALGVPSPRRKRATVLVVVVSFAVCSLAGYLQGRNNMFELLGSGLTPTILSLVFVAFATIENRFRTIAARYRILLYTSLVFLITMGFVVTEKGISAV